MSELAPELKTFADSRLRSDGAAWVTTVRPDGRPTSTPIWFVWDGKYLYFTSEDAEKGKIRNISHNPNVVVALADPYHVVSFEGKAEFINAHEHSEVIGQFSKKYASAMGVLKMDPNGRINSRLVRITPVRWRVWQMPGGSEKVDAGA
jgi:PPOX class probable F420-dependent enzyme